jgi:predicted SAM-dependent methyltransferase
MRHISLAFWGRRTAVTEAASDGLRVNIGCGAQPTPGWRNFDNSFSLTLSKYPRLSALFARLGLLNAGQIAFIAFCRQNRIEYADATRDVPLPTGSVDVIYSAYMLEHLDRVDADRFLNEALRILKVGGILRLAVPDISVAIDEYRTGKVDADEFMDKSEIGFMRPRTFAERLRMLLVGTRGHHWAYDGKSLSRLLLKNGFSEPVVLPAGETTVVNPGSLPLRDGEGWGVFVEARKPAALSH